LWGRRLLCDITGSLGLKRDGLASAILWAVAVFAGRTNRYGTFYFSPPLFAVPKFAQMPPSLRRVTLRFALCFGCQIFTRWSKSVTSGSQTVPSDRRGAFHIVDLVAQLGGPLKFQVLGACNSSSNNRMTRLIDPCSFRAPRRERCGGLRARFPQCRCESLFNRRGRMLCSRFISSAAPASRRLVHRLFMGRDRVGHRE